jgi:hypothetical protein
MIGVSRGACGQWEREITAPSTEHLARLAVLLEVNFEWLTTGRGDMDYTTGIREASLPYRPSAEFLSEEQQGLLEAYSHLTAKQRSSLLDFLKTLR